MEPLQKLVGIETELARVSGRLREFAESLDVPVVGGYHVTCSDESEWECAEAFQQLFAQSLLPALKSSRRAVFRSINLGGRYEAGAIGIAEEHFATPQSRQAFKLMVAKINAHAAVRETPAGPEYGWMDRYDCRSACCGALAAMMAGADLPAARALSELFASEGLNRLAVLADPAVVPEAHRALAAAIAGAGLQARGAVRDIEQHRPKTPTLFLVLACVTLNRPGPDTELVVGRYAVDWTAEAPTVKYEGLGDDPGAYRIRHEHGRVRVEDDQWPGD